jgi:hypothetical protein
MTKEAEIGSRRRHSMPTVHMLTLFERGASLENMLDELKMEAFTEPALSNVKRGSLRSA